MHTLSILSSFHFGHLYFHIPYRCHSKLCCSFFFFLSDLALPRNADLDDKKLIVLNPAEDELLLIGSLNRLNWDELLSVCNWWGKFYVSKIHKDSGGVFLDLVHCLSTYSAFFFQTRHHSRREDDPDTFALNRHIWSPWNSLWCYLNKRPILFQ